MKKLSILQVYFLQVFVPCNFNNSKIAIILLGTFICVVSLFYWNAYICGIISRSTLYKLLNLDLVLHIKIIVSCDNFHN